MKRSLQLLLALIAVSVARIAVADEFPRYSLGGGVGVAELRPSGPTGSGTLDGRVLFVDAAVRVHSWLAFTANAGQYRFGAPIGIISIPEDRWSYDSSNLLSLMAGVRLQPPSRSGLVPFVLSETGLSWMHWGDSHVISMLGPGITSWTIPGRSATSWCSSAAVGLITASPRHWPVLELSVRAVALMDSEQPATLVVPRISVTY